MARTGVCRCLIALLPYLTDNGKGSSAIELRMPALAGRRTIKFHQP